jgi:hypothetical protein
MISAALSERLDALIDELILDGSIDAVSLASILLAARDSVRGGYHVRLSRQVWAANRDFQDEPPSAERADDPPPEAAPWFPRPAR